MPVQYGRTLIGSLGESNFGVIANSIGQADWKSGGITIDWSTVLAVSGSPVTLNDQNVIAVGAKYLRYGQVMCKITSSVNGSVVGDYGPYDSAATDGRQTLTRGACFILNKTLYEFAPVGITTQQTISAGAFDGGKVYLERILQSGVAAHSLTAGPTLAELETVFPRLSYAR